MQLGGTAPSAVFSLGTDASVNASGGTYVAYLFAHNAGGFGLTGTDNVISCGSYTGTGNTNNPQTLGYEPQWLMIKNATMAQDWYMFDTMRGFPAASTADDYYTDTPNTDTILANTSAAEVSNFHFASPTATGFTLGRAGGTPGQSQTNSAGATYIYIAIRRGPMAVPTSGTSVFEPISNAAPTTGPLTDLTINRSKSSGNSTWAISRLTNAALETDSTNAETATGAYVQFDRMQGVTDSGWLGTSNVIWWNFKRAPSFFDEVCYNGDGTNNRAITHNLTVAPEFIIAKRRDGIGGWTCYCQYITGGASSRIILQSNAAAVTSINDWAATNPTSTNFYISSTGSAINNSGNTYVSYLFATCAGVSKVGSYTGNGTTQTIDCGFTAGARFVLIKRTDSTGDWYVWDSARGIIAGNDPYLLLNSTAAEVTNTDYVDTYNAGFELSSTAPAAINASAGTFIFLAIA